MNNELTEKQILKAIQTQDNEYISKKEEENKCTYKFEILNLFSKDSKFINGLTLSWDIPYADYYQVIGNPVNEYFLEDDNRTPGYELNYLVSINNDIVIMMPCQGGCEAYKIKNNKKTAIYPYLREGGSHEWR